MRAVSMSIATESEDDEIDPFQEHIADDPDICYNCYRRWRDTMDRKYVVYEDGYVSPIRDSMQDVVKPVSVRIDQESDVFDGEETKGRYAICKCGTPFQSLRPIDIDTAKRYAERICDHLHRKNVEFDEDEFFAEMFHMKREPDNQYKIDVIFKIALNRSV